MHLAGGKRTIATVQDIDIALRFCGREINLLKTGRHLLDSIMGSLP